VSSAILPTLKVTTSEAAARFVKAAESTEGRVFGTWAGFGVEGLVVSMTVRGVPAGWKVGVHWIFP